MDSHGKCTQAHHPTVQLHLPVTTGWAAGYCMGECVAVEHGACRLGPAVAVQHAFGGPALTPVLLSTHRGPSSVCDGQCA